MQGFTCRLFCVSASLLVFFSFFFSKVLKSCLCFISRFQKGGVGPPDVLCPFRPERWRVSFSNEGSVSCALWPLAKTSLKAHLTLRQRRSTQHASLIRTNALRYCYCIIWISFHQNKKSTFGWATVMWVRRGATSLNGFILSPVLFQTTSAVDE